MKICIEQYALPHAGAMRRTSLLSVHKTLIMCPTLKLAIFAELHSQISIHFLKSFRAITFLFTYLCSVEGDERERPGLLNN